MKTKLPVKFSAPVEFYPPIKTAQERRVEAKWHEQKARRWTSRAGVFSFHKMIASALSKSR